MFIVKINYWVFLGLLKPSRNKIVQVVMSSIYVPVLNISLHVMLDRRENTE